MRTRFREWSLASALFTIAWPSLVAAVPFYDIEELEPLPGLFPLTAVHDIDDAGRATGRTWKQEAIGAQNHHAVLWSADAQPGDLGDDGYWSEARGISRTGFIAGRHDVAGGMRGALWTSGGRQMLLPLPGQPASEAYDVDDTGMAVGVSLISSTDATAVRWVNGIAHILPGANGMSYAVAVNGAGRAVGRRDVWPERHAMLWEGASYTLLPDLGGRYAWATNISENGTICGGGMDTHSQLHSVLWSGPAHAISALADPGFGAYTRVNDVNDDGTAVGEICLSIECEPGDQRALLWADGQVYDLNGLIPLGTGWTLWSASAINDHGEIVCIGAQTGFVSPRGFKLTPRAATSVAGTTTAATRLTLSPNPTHGDGDVAWALSVPGSATLNLYDVTGRRVGGRFFASLPSGVSHASLASFADVAVLPSGIYMLELKRDGGSSEFTRITVVK